MRIWEIKEDSENTDYQNLPPHSPASEARYIARGVGTKFLLYKAKDYNQIVGLRWELTDEFDPLNPDHIKHAYADIDITEPVFKLWNEVLIESEHIDDIYGKFYENMSKYIGSLDNEQIDDIFNNYLSDEANTSFSYSNIDTPQQFLRFQNTGNSERSVFLFEGTLIYNSINKQVI